MSTGPFYSINQAVLHDRSTPYLRQAIRRVLDGTSVPEPPHIYCGPLYRTPQLHSILLYAFQSAMFIVWKIWRRLIGRKWDWGVAYLWNDWEDAVLFRSTIIPNPKGSFIADPFEPLAKFIEGVIFDNSTRSPWSRVRSAAGRKAVTRNI